MVILKEIGRRARALGQKMTPVNIHNVGQKALQTGCVISGKVSNTLRKIESVSHIALPIASKIATMSRYTELGALTTVGNSMKQLVQARENLDSVRNMFHQ